MTDRTDETGDRQRGDRQRDDRTAVRPVRRARPSGRPGAVGGPAPPPRRAVLVLAAALLLPGSAPASAGTGGVPAGPVSRAGSAHGLTRGAGPSDSRAASAGPGTAGDTAGCELRLRPRRIAVQEAAVLVTVLASADPGALRGVELAPRSRVTVLKAAPARDRDGVVARMALDTSGARPGRWQVMLRGGTADCRGTLAVTDGGGRRGR